MNEKGKFREFWDGLDFKKMAYQSTGTLLEWGGCVYAVKGLISGSAEEFWGGMGLVATGIILEMRTEYVTENMAKLQDRVNELEEKLERNS